MKQAQAQLEMAAHGPVPWVRRTWLQGARWRPDLVQTAGGFQARVARTIR